MGIDFLRNNGAQRVRNYDPQPLLLTDGAAASSTPDETVSLEYETSRTERCWEPYRVGDMPSATWQGRPLRFVDGKDVGRTVAWLQSEEGFPVPVRLSEIGAVAMREVNGALRREYAVVERVVSLIVDLFPWDEVESFAIALQEHGLRLLPCQKPPRDPENPEHEVMYDFERMRKSTANRSMDEMTRLECRALAQESTVPTIIDGRLEPRTSGFQQHEPVVGLIKTLHSIQLHAEGWRTFYNLCPRERTPAFVLKHHNLSVVSWYLRLDGQYGELPNWGIVRLEVPQTFFEETAGEDWTYLDRLSRFVCDCRSRDAGYSRAPVSIHPIQRAEQSLGSLFTMSDMLISRFYALTDL